MAITIAIAIIPYDHHHHPCITIAIIPASPPLCLHRRRHAIHLHLLGPPHSGLALALGGGFHAVEPALATRTVAVVIVAVAG